MIVCENKLSILIVVRPCNTRKPALPSNDHSIETAAGAVDDLDVSVLVPASCNADMTVTGIDYKVSRFGLAPGDGVAVIVLRNTRDDRQNFRHTVIPTV